MKLHTTTYLTKMGWITTITILLFIVGCFRFPKGHISTIEPNYTHVGTMFQTGELLFAIHNWGSKRPYSREDSLDLINSMRFEPIRKYGYTSRVSNITTPIRYELIPIGSKFLITRQFISLEAHGFSTFQVQSYLLEDSIGRRYHTKERLIASDLDWGDDSISVDTSRNWDIQWFNDSIKPFLELLSQQDSIIIAGGSRPFTQYTLPVEQIFSILQFDSTEAEILQYTKNIQELYFQPDSIEVTPPSQFRRYAFYTESALLSFLMLTLSEHYKIDEWIIE